MAERRIKIVYNSPTKGKVETAGPVVEETDNYVIIKIDKYNQRLIKKELVESIKEDKGWVEDKIAESATAK